MPKPGYHEPNLGRTGNRLLDGLPEGAFSLLAPSLVHGSLELKQPLMRADQPIRDIYFPATAMVTMIIAMEDGSEVKTALIGAEGMVGQVVSLGLDVGLQGAMCSARGEAWSLPARLFREALTSSHPLDSMIRRYTAVSIRQAAQLVACNALHPVAERLCRWLLMAHDRAGGGTCSP